MKPKFCIQRIMSYLKDGVWEVDLDTLGFFKRIGVQSLRFFSNVIRIFLSHRCGLHSAGLTYFSILSVIPVLLMMLLLTKPCGMYEWAREKLRVQTDEMISTFFEAKSSTVTNTVASVSSSGIAASVSSVETNTTAVSAVRDKTATIAVSAASDKPAAAAEFGAQARQLRDQVLGQIDAKIGSFNFGLMALVGFCVLAWTVISTFGQIEASLNEIWHAKNRPVWRRAYLYVSTIMIVPLFTVFALSMPLLRAAKKIVDSTLGATTYTRSLGDVLVSLLNSSLFTNTVTFVFASLAIAFIFKAMPNRHVSTRAALEGGCLTALLLGSWLRICAMLQFGIANSSAAYGSFALIPILIVWINISWTIILLGSIITYALQCLHSRVRDLPEFA